MTVRFEADPEAAAHHVETWCGEPLLHEGEDPAVALAEGTVRRAALDAALAEMGRGLPEPSYEWRRDYALVLGLERVLNDPQPKLASGTTLRRHQVDALAGQLAALIGDLERRALHEDDENGNGNGDADEAEDEEEAGEFGVEEGAGKDDDEDEDDEDLDDEDEDDDLDADDELDDEDEDDAGAEPEPPFHDPAVAAVEVDDEDEAVVDEIGPDPGAVRRYRFKHPTASGKTIAAAGFVEAARTTGVLILTHRRLLVNQFTRDLTEEGYGGRMHEPVLIGQTTPRTPPLTINTYAWFIKHADQIKRDVYGVIVCDEAHTALGEKTAAAIRRFSEPVYIGMTATDQLLQKHVGDVFPAEVADFPLAEAVRRGVVAPLRCVRVKPIASLRQVEIVGGDFDQGQLAAALDVDPLNLAAADLYQSRFGDTPGIVYAAGVDHAERVAAAMRAIGLAAAAVSGRTPPRELAETLAAYERGEINVLVNAQILAEGWNAPRATVCMHLAPTASRRVYQQRVGRIMRLHRRKEAGVVVDFAEVGAPHSERVITLHSLLDVDAFRPGGLVTPPPPRRRRGRRKPARPIVKEANWIVPVSDDPERRVAVIASQWKHVDASKLPIDEQRAWAVVAARSLAPGDVHTLTERIVGLQPEARELFFFTCAAENKHRKLRLSSLGDLAAAGPSQTTFAMACRLVEAAPTWQQDRGQGARVLLLAMGDGKIEAPADRIVAWTWQLARAARDHEYRYAGSHIPDGRSLLGALAGAKSDAEHSEACLRLAAIARDAPLEAGAALLAVAAPRRGTAGERLIESARRSLSEDPVRLAAALGANIPAPAQRSKQARKTKRKAEKAVETVSFNGAVVGSTPPATPIKRVDGAVEVEIPAAVAVRLRDDADEVLAGQVGPQLRWRLAGDEEARVFPTAIEVRAAGAGIAPLAVAVAKLLNEPIENERTAPVRVDGAGLVLALEPDEAAVLADDAARRVLAQLKTAGVRGRVRVEFELRGPEGELVRDSRPGAVRKIARGEPVGASPDRRDRRRRSRGKRGRRGGAAVQAAEAATVADQAAAAHAGS
ncbi:MAG TPA: DEAD/DEAH box helicase family protein [Gaiellales bacterium]|nr:DEAD/DEAH box helicase family protein [Gaiellales bacterium]